MLPRQFDTKKTRVSCSCRVHVPKHEHEHEIHEIFVFRHENFSCSKIKFSCLDTKIKKKTLLDTNGHDINTKFFYIKIFKLQFLSLFFDTLAPKYNFFFIFEFNSLLLKTIWWLLMKNFLQKFNSRVNFIS